MLVLSRNSGQRVVLTLASGERQIAVGWSWSVIARMEAVEQYGPIADLVRELVQNIDACESAEAAVMIDGELKTVYAVVPRLVCLD
jgi:hypothetical protein